MKRLPTDWQILKDSINNRSAKRFNALMHTSNDKDFAVLFFKILPYFHPMKKRKEVIIQVKETPIRIVHVYPGDTSAK